MLLRKNKNNLLNLQVQDLLNLLDKQAKQQFLAFYKNLFDKNPNKQVKDFINYSIKLIINIDFSNSFLVFNPQNLQELFFILAKDFENTGSGIIWQPKSKYEDIANYYSILLDNRLKKLLDVFDVTHRQNFINIFSINKKQKKQLQDVFITFSEYLLNYIKFLSFNLANSMFVIGKFNPKFWDDSVMEVYTYSFVLQSFIIVSKFLLFNKRINCFLLLNNQYLIDCLNAINNKKEKDFISNLENLELQHNEFIKTTTYNNTKKFYNILLEIYEKESSKYKFSTIKL